MSERCLSCAERLPANARFCPACGTSAATGSDARRRPLVSVGVERRAITVACCDLVGSTELSTRVDAEDFGELIQAYHERAVDVAHRFGGAVESYSGDGILFRFGWPLAHDDDPERAVRAALEIVAVSKETTTSGDRLSVRIGVHTGPVVIGEMGGSQRREVMALGETVNIAARLESVAAPNSVVVSATTAALVPGLFVLENLGPQTLKGIAVAVHAYRAVQPSGVRSKLDAAKDVLTPFVGRPTELDQLLARWQQATRGAGRCVLVTGDAGVGKSRLVYQLRESLGTTHSWIECGCSSFTTGTAFRPVIDLVEQGLQLRSQDSPAERLGTLRRAVQRAALPDPDAVALLANLLAIPVPEGITPLTMSPERRRRRTIDLLTSWVTTLAARQPTVVVMEDLHWSDPSSLELLGDLATCCRDVPLLVIGTARPDVDIEWATTDLVDPIALQPLADGDVRAIVASLSGSRDLPGPVLDRIVDEAAGIPLFAEEVSRMVLESGMLTPAGDRWVLNAPLERLEIPSTLQGSLLARLDRLGPTKRIAQLASVIGREFSIDLLSELVDADADELVEGLERLVESDLVFIQQAGPDTSYVFKHALIQEAAYDSLLRRARRSTHQRLADVLQRRREEGMSVNAEVIARHFEAAGQVFPAARHYRLAADAAVTRSGYREAMSHLQRGIGLLGAADDDPIRDELEIDMQMALGAAIIGARSYSDPAIEDAYARARVLCERLGDDARAGYSLAGLSIYYTNRGEIAVGAELAERVLVIADATSDDVLELLGRVQLAHPRQYECRTIESLEHAERALAIYEPERHRSIAHQFGTDHGVAAHMFAGWALMVLGRADSALAHLEQAVTLATELEQPFDEAYAYLFKATIHWARGESQEVIDAAGTARRLAEEQGFDFWTALSRLFETAELIVRTGDAALVPTVIEASLVAGESGNRGGSTPVLARVAEALRAAGDPNGALAMVDAALAVSEETGQRWWDADLQRLQAELLVESATDATASETFERAERLLVDAIELARQRGFVIHELRAASSLLHLRRATNGDIADARGRLHEAFERCTEGFGTPFVVEARALLDESTPDQAGSPRLA